MKTRRALINFVNHHFFVKTLMLTPPTDHSVYGTDGSSLDLDSGSPAYKRLISQDFSQTEVISLIEEAFTSQDEVEAIDHLGRDDIQTFIDVVDEVWLTHNPLGSDLIVVLSLCLICLTVTIHPPMARP